MIAVNTETLEIVDNPENGLDERVWIYNPTEGQLVSIEQMRQIRDAPIFLNRVVEGESGT
jgi:hypothetical protein